MTLPHGPYDIGPQRECSDPEESYTASDWLYEAEQRIGESESVNLLLEPDIWFTKTRASRDAIDNAISAATEEILDRWKVKGKTELVTDDVINRDTPNAPEWRRLLHRDMRAIGWNGFGLRIGCGPGAYAYTKYAKPTKHGVING